MRDSRLTHANEADWDAIYRDHEWRVRRFLWRKVPSSVLDDVVQETFLRAYGSRHRLDPTRPPGPWLLTIARRARADALEVLPPAASVDVDKTVAVATDADPHLGFERRLRRQAMAMALASLSPRHRRLLIEWELKGELDFAALAREEGITPQALKSVLGRARQAFRGFYATAAERTGAAAAVAWVRVMRRNRTHRTTSWSTAGLPLMEAAMGGMVALATATVLLHAAAPGAAQAVAAQRAAAVDIGALAIASATVPAPVDAPPRPTHATGEAEPRSTPPPPPGLGAPVAAQAEADIEVGETASSATLRLGLQNPSGPLHLNSEVELRCDGVVRAAGCEVARRTPLAE
jgi:RNA polymerase sigma-70 factor (ECF subfamily)